MKTDLTGSVIIGFLIAVLFISISYSTVTVIRPDKAPPFYYWFSIVIFPMSLAGGMFVITDLKNKIGNRFFVIYQLYKFSLVAGLSILFDAVIYNSLIVATQTPSGDPATLFKSIGFMASVINSYFWNKYWTFSSKSRNIAFQFSLFFLISLAGLGIYMGADYVLSSVIGPLGGITPVIAGLAGIIFSGAWNFLGYKYFIFAQR